MRFSFLKDFSDGELRELGHKIITRKFGYGFVFSFDVMNAADRIAKANSISLRIAIAIRGYPFFPKH